jgi:riboflavin kinase / FMN adenylyltransferase
MSGFAEYSLGDMIAQQHTGAVVAIGNFDGMHRGHQELLSVARAQAQRSGKAWGLLTLEPHPRSYFKPHEPVFRLTPRALKVRLAKALGADFMLCLDFNEAMAACLADDFIKRFLVEQLDISHVVTGYDFHFGKGRKGTSDTLRSTGAAHGFGVSVVDQVTDDGDGRAPFSSSSIRSALRRGHVKEAARELGYHWIVMGEVVHGDKRGRTIGFPTANIVLDPGAEPFRGIYALNVCDAANTAVRWTGAGYFGDRPTFNTNRTFLEVYLLDQDIDLYGRTMMVSFIDLIRGDKTFRSVDELVAQMRDDCTEARRIVGAVKQDDPCTEFLIGKLQAAGRV